MAASSQFVEMEHACFFYRKDVNSGAVDYRHSSSKDWTPIQPGSLALPLKVVEGLAAKVKQFHESIKPRRLATAA